MAQKDNARFAAYSSTIRKGRIEPYTVRKEDGDEVIADPITSSAARYSSISRDFALPCKEGHTRMGLVGFDNVLVVH